jgi:hypothetical protein
LVIISLGAFAIATPLVGSFASTYNLMAPFATIILTPLVSIVYTFSLLVLPFQSL